MCADCLDEYVEWYEWVWFEMFWVFVDSGWYNYLFFLCDDGLFVGYVESFDFEVV